MKYHRALVYIVLAAASGLVAGCGGRSVTRAGNDNVAGQGPAAPGGDDQITAAPTPDPSPNIKREPEPEPPPEPGWTPEPVPPPPEPPLVGETVVCEFEGSSAQNECYSSTGASCQGKNACKVWVEAPYGMPVEWKSSCGDYRRTITDGNDETIVWQCKPETPPPPPPPPPEAAEAVTCVFYGSNTPQTCYSPHGQCTGNTSCTIKVFGPLGEKVTWKSSCGGYAHTVIDGVDEQAPFKCPVANIVSETVYCVFNYGNNPTAVQSCNSSKGSCKGIYGCPVTISGYPGETVAWSSSCTGSGLTVVDGTDKKVSFACGVSF